MGNISSRSCKNKGAKFQKEIAACISELINIPFGKDECIASRQMGGTGTDIILVGPAKKLFPWSVECFGKGTLVVTDKGYKCIEDIVIGDKVLTHKGRFRKVTNIFSHYAPTGHLKYNASSEVINVTSEHPFENVDGNFDPVHQIKHVTHICATKQNVDRFFKGRKFRLYDPSNRSRNSSKTLHEFLELSPNIMFLLGLYIAEGHYSKRCVTITMHIDEIPILDRLVKICWSELGVRCSIIPNLESKAVALNIHSTELSSWFSTIWTKSSHNKCLGIFLFAKRNLLKHLLLGYFEGDGCLHPDYARCETTSRTLAYEIQFALLRYGVYSSISKTHRRDNPLYSVQISQSSYKRFLSIFYTSGNQELAKVEVSSNDKVIYNLHESRVISRSDYTESTLDELVYNISVDEDETYVIQGGIVVHNCKNDKSFNLKAWIRQASLNTLDNTNWIVFFKKNQFKPVVCFEFSVFLQLFKDVVIQKAYLYDTSVWHLEDYIRHARVEANSWFIRILYNDNPLVLLDMNFFFKLLRELPGEVKGIT